MVSGIVYCSNSNKPGVENAENEKLQDPATLTNSYLMKNAAGVTVDAACSLLTQTVAALLQTHSDYVEVMLELMRLMEYNVSLKGYEHEQDRVWELILEARAMCNELKQEQQKLLQTFRSLERMMESVGEAAFATGAEYPGIIAGERLFSAQVRVNHAQKSLEEIEERLQQTNVRMIEETAKREEEKNKRKLQQEQLDEENDNDTIEDDDTGGESGQDKENDDM
ncbi:unnamed protein product [Owenia fusiformis]|uniref:Direct IAP-binding protein with low pI n=1 Tax=Owenia fusiformis TaxID=6347 RepID=A0A8J1UDR7_OWEFU|nr:unnamed protein product [Owenia fusiformis]